jgi:putative GTP pyrophosphokinase
MPDDMLAAYEARLDLLRQVRDRLEAEIREALAGLPHIDRIGFRVKEGQSFLAKATSAENRPPYGDPLVEIEDQVAGRVIVFFLQDLEMVKKHLAGTLTTVEHTVRKPEKYSEFGYESEHLICLIPPQVRPPGWAVRRDLPKTFELQLRTVYMHAFAEPQHDLGYKASSELPIELRRELAWIAASSWGADQAYRRFWAWVEQRKY